MNRREAIAALVSLPATATVTRAEVGPSDVIVVESDDVLNCEQAERIRHVLQEVWPGRKTVVFGGGLKVKIVREP